MLSKKRNGWLWVVMLFAVCAVVYGVLSSYPRELAVYSDELRYLDVARSLLQGRGLRVRNMPSDYQKILYPLCILPALLLKTTAAQITAIGWLNAVYMASAVFPAYALARAMGMNRRRTAFLVGVTAVLPTMSAASTFMSETVFLPLSLWQVYFFLRAMLAEPKARVGWCAAAGAFCYLLYLNKEVALYYLIAWVLVRAWVWWHDKASWLAVWRAVIAVGVAVLGVLLVCRRGRRVLAGAALVLCVLCYAGEWRINRWTYEVPAGTAQQASALNDALAELDGRVLFIPYGVRQRDSQLIETYVARDVYIVEYETLLQSGALADGVLDLTAEAVGPEYPGRAYTDLDAADWVLAADGVPVDTTTLEKADAACPAGYVLYRNLDAQRVRFLS